MSRTGGFLCWFGVALICPISAVARPVITSVTGALGDGQVIVISGSNFGSGYPAPILWDDFEGGTDGASLNLAPKVGSWDLNSNPTPKYSSSNCHSGLLCSYGAASTGNDLATQFGSPASGNMPETFYYIYFWFKYSYPTAGTGQSKFIQLWGTYQQGDYNPGVMSGGFSGGWWATYIALEGGTMSLQSDFTGDVPTKGTWHLAEMILKQSSPNSTNGSVEIRVDNAIKYQQANVKTRLRSGESWEKIWFFYGFTNMSGSKYVYLDDVYVNSSWSRVMIGDAPTLENCTRKELQMASSWSNGTIQVNSRRGSFTNGQAAYLYVFDSAGSANTDGFPITVGSSLSAPTNLRIKP